MVHIDPEDDEGPGLRTRRLPLRGPIMERVRAHWNGIDGVADIERVTIHYLNGQVEIDVELSLPRVEEAERLDLELNQAVAADPQIAGVRVLFAKPHQ